MTVHTIQRDFKYETTVELRWMAKIVSPITGNDLVAYAEDPDEARKLLDLELVKEAHAAGMTVVGRFDPQDRP